MKNAYRGAYPNATRKYGWCYLMQVAMVYHGQQEEYEVRILPDDSLNNKVQSLEKKVWHSLEESRWSW